MMPQDGGMATWTGGEGQEPGDEAVGAAPKPGDGADGPVFCGCGHRVVAHWHTDVIPAREGFGSCTSPGCECWELHDGDGDAVDVGGDPLSPADLELALATATPITPFERRLLGTLRVLTAPDVTITTLMRYRRVR